MEISAKMQFKYGNTQSWILLVLKLNIHTPTYEKLRNHLPISGDSWKSVYHRAFSNRTADVPKKVPGYLNSHKYIRYHSLFFS